ncbi:anaerobic sulfatase maturase [Pasteurellaceae bacterium LIM206]|nr:anaerobic sulfatase maturase [Pasteurellaceae bacterium LIM206]
MLSFMLKPTSFQCNIQCDYCFYLEKEAFISPCEKTPFMRLDMAEHFIRQHIRQTSDNTVFFTWQGGEPLMAGLEFYQQIVQIQQDIAKEFGKTVKNAIQTNGILINEKWADFFKQHDILIGISIDGDEELHNAYRVNRAGKGTFEQVKNAINLLNEKGVEFNTLTVVNNLNARHAVRVYRLLKSLGSRYMQFIPVVETQGLDDNFKPQWLNAGSILPVTTPFSISAQQYADFINALFNEWIIKDVGRISVQLFESIFARYCGFEALMCIYREKCGGENLALEANGDVYSCDHFVYPEYKMGNIQDLSEQEIAQKATALSARKQALNQQCQACEWKTFCHGGCPKHRFITNAQGERHNYFCTAYKQIFQHLMPAMNFMVTLKQQGYPIELVSLYRDRIYSTE